MLSALEISTIISTFIVLNSLNILLSSTPNLLMLFTITHALLICAFTKMIMLVSWFSMLLFLIFVGGLLILFTYITSLSPNNFMKSNKFMNLLIVASGFILMPPLVYSQESVSMLSKASHNLVSLIFKIYTPQLISLMLSMFFFLLLVLLISVFLVMLNKGPLRNLTKLS